ncbi:MFS general substrate transporter [Byssothecium circinans]|uniref:MFS general substrate transporter n=1 Tax=Byssothecium circinans TaxID=147558 RepID=A0A6A5UB49_9PLEO|nr:MFS general substrate transporter [Byssothecium circinans]
MCQSQHPGAHSQYATTPNTTAPANKPISFYFAFLALNIGVFIVSPDATALAVAIPASLSFVLAVAITQPIYTSTSDVLGRKAPSHTAYSLFLARSVVFAVAKNMRVLIVGRVLQGLGGDGLDVLSEVILVDMTSLKERPLYLGLFTIPMAGGGVVLTVLFMRLHPVDASYRSKLRQLDWVVISLFTIGCTLFSLPLSWAGSMYPWTSWQTLLPFLVGFVIIVIFTAYERRPEEPIFPYRIFHNRTAVVTIIGATIHGVMMNSVMLFTPLFFQAVKLEPPFTSAVSVLPASASIIGFSIISAVAIEVIRKYRWIVISNWVFSAVGVGLWALWNMNSSTALTAGLQILAGVGIGTHFTVLTIPMQANLVSWFLFGGLIGLAVSTGVFNNVFERRIASIEHLPQELDALTDVKKAIGFIPALRLIDIDQELLKQVVGAFGGIGFATSLVTKEITLENEDKGRQHFERGVTS